MREMIYVLDDESNIRDLVKAYMEKEGYDVKTFSNGTKLMEAIKDTMPDMFILDIMLPDIDGYEICKEIRKSSDVPIIFVSARDEEFDRVLGLELGSDDYISKPFSPRELTARVKNIFKRIKTNPVSATTGIIKLSDVEICSEERKVSAGNTIVDLTSKEYDLLYFLCKNKNKVFKRDELINKIWGYDYIGDTRAIDDLVKRIRKKLIDAHSVLEIITVWGYGYKIAGD